MLSHIVHGGPHGQIAIHYRLLLWFLPQKTFTASTARSTAVSRNNTVSSCRSSCSIRCRLLFICCIGNASNFPSRLLIRCRSLTSVDSVHPIRPMVISCSVPRRIDIVCSGSVILRPFFAYAVHHKKRYGICRHRDKAWKDCDCVPGPFRSDSVFLEVVP